MLIGGGPVNATVLIRTLNMLNPYEASRTEPVSTATSLACRTLIAFICAIATAVPVYFLFRFFAEGYVSVYRSSVSTLYFWTSMLTWPTFGIFLATVTHVARSQFKLTFNSQLGMAIFFGLFVWSTAYVDKVMGFRVTARDGLEFASVSGANYAHAISLACFWIGSPLLVILSMLGFTRRRPGGLRPGQYTFDQDKPMDRSGRSEAS